MSGEFPTRSPSRYQSQLHHCNSRALGVKGKPRNQVYTCQQCHIQYIKCFFHISSLNPREQAEHLWHISCHWKPWLQFPQKHLRHPVENKAMSWCCTSDADASTKVYPGLAEPLRLLLAAQEPTFRRVQPQETPKGIRREGSNVDSINVILTMIPAFGG